MPENEKPTPNNKSSKPNRLKNVSKKETAKAPKTPKTPKQPKEKMSSSRKVVIIAAAAIVVIAVAIILIAVLHGSDGNTNGSTVSGSGAGSSVSAGETDDIAGGDTDKTDAEEESSVDVGQATHTTAAGTTYTKYTAEGMAADLNYSYSATKEKYLKKYVTVTGVLSAVSGNETYFIMNPSSGYPETDEVNFTCYISGDKQKELVRSLSEGKEVTVSGQVKFIGQVGGFEIDADSVTA